MNKFLWKYILKIEFTIFLKSIWSSLDVILSWKVKFKQNSLSFYFVFITARTYHSLVLHYYCWNIYKCINSYILWCTLLQFILFFYFSFRNLRRLVHAMILKRPPHEWIGAFRSFFCFVFSCFFYLTVAILLLHKIPIIKRQIMGLVTVTTR